MHALIRSNLPFSSADTWDSDNSLMSLPLLLIPAAMLVCWSFLRVLGNERQRKVQNRDAEPRRPTPPANSEAAVGQQVVR
jgi:hypothetical protein